MANLRKFDLLIERYSDLADFVLVYIAEAHPTDGWKFDWNLFSVRSHRNMEERMEAARKMVDAEPQECPVVVDDFSNELTKAYNAIPERLYIVQEGIIVYEGGFGPMDYKLNEVEKWLKLYKKNKN